jgi:hypothetical protein
VKNRNKYWLLLALGAFVIYVFAAAQPIPEETILAVRWLSSLESNYPLYLESAMSLTKDAAPSRDEVPSGDAAPRGDEASTTGGLLPFQLGNRFGYVDAEGRFSINQIKQGYLSIAPDQWAEYEAIPGRIDIWDPKNAAALSIEAGRGYPLFLDNRIFLLGDEQNAVTALDAAGNVRWTYDFAAPITDIDAAAGLVLVGTLDGTVDLLNENGSRIFFFEPGGSRLSVIYGCRISRDGSKLAIVSGFDDQRFLLLERFGGTYRVSYHEFLADGFRREVSMAFIDGDQRVAFEREGGLGIYHINSRTSLKIPLRGGVIALDESGEEDLLFVITSQPDRKKNLVGIRFPGTIIMETPFQSDHAFLSRQGRRLYVGGGNTLAAFDLGKR